VTTLVEQGPFILILSGITFFCLSMGCGAWAETASSDFERRFPISVVVSMWSAWLGLLGFVFWAYDWWVMDVILSIALLIGLAIVGLPWLFGEIATEREEQRRRAMTPFTTKLKYGQRRSES
jgi:hypothetical protein